MAPGRLRLSPVRSPASLQLDGQRTPVVRSRGTGGDPLPPFVAWSDFYSDFASRYDQSHHVTLVGSNGSGKTTLARHLILLRRYVAVAATKVRDTSLYRPLEREGFVTVDAFTSDPDQPRQIVNPQLEGVGLAARQHQQAVFGEMLSDIWQTGRWCIFADEVRYLTDNLKLATEMETLWLQGRALDISIVAGTQRPVGIPLEAFSQASHLFLARETDVRNIDRMAEFVAGDKEIVKYTIPRLPRYEFLYVELTTGRMARTKVESSR